MFNTKTVHGATRGARGFCAFLPHRTLQLALVSEAAIAQLGERETEDLQGPGAIPGLGNSSLPAAPIEIAVAPPSLCHKRRTYDKIAKN